MIRIPEKGSTLFDQLCSNLLSNRIDDFSPFAVKNGKIRELPTAPDRIPCLFASGWNLTLGAHA